MSDSMQKQLIIDRLRERLAQAEAYTARCENALSQANEYGKEADEMLEQAMAERDEARRRLAQAEADRDVLAAEVMAWRDADASHELLEAIDVCDVYGHRHAIENAQKEVDASGALQRAKEAK